MSGTVRRTRSMSLRDGSGERGLLEQENQRLRGRVEEAAKEITALELRLRTAEEHVKGFEQGSKSLVAAFGLTGREDAEEMQDAIWERLRELQARSSEFSTAQASWELERKNLQAELERLKKCVHTPRVIDNVSGGADDAAVRHIKALEKDVADASVIISDLKLGKAQLASECSTLDSRIVTRSLTGLERRPDGPFTNTADTVVTPC